MNVGLSRKNIVFSCSKALEIEDYILMTDDLNVKVTIIFNDPDLNDDELEEQAQNLLTQLKDLDDLDDVERVLDPHPPEGNKSVGSFLVGLVKATVNLENAKKLLGFLGDRLGNKVIEMAVEHNGKKLSVKAHSKEELEVAVKAAKDFISL